MGTLLRNNTTTTTNKWHIVLFVVLALGVSAALLMALPDVALASWRRP